VYLTESEFAHLEASKSIKSAYVIFQEYMECALEDRDKHIWKDIYAKYYRKAGWAFNDPDTMVLTDADIFSYLCWTYAANLSKLDTTAGARAIFFYWRRISEHDRIQLVSYDTSFHDPIRMNNMAVIDLNKLCKSYNGKLYARELTEWKPVKLGMYYANSSISSDPSGCIGMKKNVKRWREQRESDVLIFLNLSASKWDYTDRLYYIIAGFLYS